MLQLLQLLLLACLCAHTAFAQAPSERPTKNLRRVSDESLDSYGTIVETSEGMRAWHKLPCLFQGQLTDLPLEIYNTLYVVVCRNRGLQCFARGTWIIIGVPTLETFHMSRHFKTFSCTYIAYNYIVE